MPREPLPLFLNPGPLGTVEVRLMNEWLKAGMMTGIPTARNLAVLDEEAFQAVDFADGSIDRTACFRQAARDKQPGKIGSEGLIFPVPGTDRLVIVAGGMDELVVERASVEWLADINRVLDEELLRLRFAGLDGSTSLPSAVAFSAALERMRTVSGWRIVLVEAFSRNSSPRDVFRQVYRTARSLHRFNRFSYPLFHLGNSVFAIIIADGTPGRSRAFCSSLIAHMRSEGYKRVHCGCSGAGSSDDTEAGSQSERLGAEAWQALNSACRRGPFAFCEYDTLVNPEHVLVRPLSRKTKNRMQTLWRKSVAFSLIFLKPDLQPREHLDDLVAESGAAESVITDELGYLVFRDHVTVDEAKRWAERLIGSLTRRHGRRASMSAGVCAYPLKSYTKTDMIKNCQKALIHASFFGPGSVVVFDALSLNVSGDVYFGEGDLAGAVREYRLGLDMEPSDINLLNSLGVTYALMNRRNAAIRAFNRVLEIEPANFMAHYNLGLDEQAAGAYRRSLAHFRKALEAYCPDDEDEQSVLEDLTYQLGVALHHCDFFAECCKILEDWYCRQDDTRLRGKCCRYIGMSYYAMAMYDESAAWLQRALVFDEFDAECLSLLGQVYLNIEQGAEIALSLCEKSLEVDGANTAYVLRCARALAACGQYERAVSLLRECVRKKAFKHSAWYELADVYRRLGDNRKSRAYARKLSGAVEAPEKLRRRAETLLIDL